MIIKLYNTQTDSVGGRRDSDTPNSNNTPTMAHPMYASPLCTIVENAENISYEILASEDFVSKIICVRCTVPTTGENVGRYLAEFQANVRAVICNDEGKTVEVINL